MPRPDSANVPHDAQQEVPPFSPDPDIVGNDEGNQRILERDRDTAREFLRNQDKQQ